jgi:two-component system, OmpR family, response regulator MprA
MFVGSQGPSRLQPVADVTRIGQADPVILERVQCVRSIRSCTGRRPRRDGRPREHPDYALSMQILVVDDDPAVRDSLQRSLQYNGYEVTTAGDGLQALASLAAHRPDAVIMDVMMPRLDGLEATRMLRAAGNDVPILVLTARDAVNDRIDGLDAGGDDYLAKPFALDELLARLRALIRRAGPPVDASDPSTTALLTFSDLMLNTQTREVLRGSRAINLTRTEFALLESFMRHPRRVLERSWLLNEVWGFDFPTTANSLEVYIGYLRRKTEASDEPRLIHTVRGVGYVLRETPP